MKTMGALGAFVMLLPLAGAAKDEAAEGRRLVEQHRCEACHERNVPGEGAIYTRSDHKVTSWPKLEAQVAACNTMLNTGLFPEEEAAIAAYLNATYYKFPKVR